ncbi:tetratricopeptide repeat protein [Actinomadura opuntiae]|uniref:tetratricopeptide repeat protein n=1 Tax=Actinomadura sp. OS1-43 TaxID=604315 RepID=UPI00255B2426|nr:tetratricopeptide repeat protein [Actinomadura sp. OS1-43]MDL4818628.1 tetratricopeptide repeat protein [Actinomadura sp. OS1-43]
MGDVHRAETVVQARDILGGVHTHYHSGPRSRPIPRALPPVTLYFTDREELLCELTDAWRLARENGVPLVVVISGPAGMGKTELATKWSWQIAGEVPGPHLYKDMKDGGLASAKDALGEFLRAMGVEPAEVPRTLAEMTAMFRTLTSENPAIVFLDDVTLASQVRAVVPNSAGSVVVVTAREPLENVPNVQSFEVKPMELAAAVMLIERLAGTVDGAEAIAALCKGQPLSLSAAARQMKRRGPSLSEEIATERAAERKEVVMAVFGAGYRGLSAKAARLYRCLGALFGRHFSADLAAAAAGLDDVAAPLAELVDAGLVEEAGTAFRLHALALKHAREQATQEEHEAALQRVVDWYLRTAVAADYTVMPQRWWLGPEYQRYRGQRPPMERASAWQWLQDQRAAMLAAVRAAVERGWYDKAVQLVEAQWSLCFKGKYHDHWLAVFELGREAAVRLSDSRFEGRIRCQLGFGYMELDRLDAAAAEFTEASRAERLVGHVRGLATAVESLGLLDLRRSGAEILPALTARGDFAARALELLTENLSLNLQMSEENDDDRAVALAWRHRGRALSATGNHDDAITHLRRARELIAAVPDPYNEGRALTDLGQAYLRAGRNAEAVPLLREAIDVLGTDENRVERAVVFETLSAAAERANDRETAASWLESALEVLDGRPAAKVQALRERLVALTGPA